MLDNYYHQLSGVGFLLFFLLASMPILFFNGVKTIASAISFFVYILAYIPFIHALWSYNYPSSLVFAYSLVLFLSMCLFFMTDSLYFGRSFFRIKRGLLPFHVLEKFIYVLLIITVLMNLSQLHFSNFISVNSDLYEARANNNMKGAYFVFWLKGALLPLLEVYYLKKRKYLGYGLVVVGFVLLYMIDKQKFTFLFPFILTGLFYVIMKSREYFMSRFHVTMISLLAIPAFILVYYLHRNNLTVDSSPFLFIVVSIFVMRSICICGMETVRYMDFFEIQKNPYTYYGHVNIIDAIFHVYPYSQSVGQTVSTTGGNSNATFWMMDGVAAGGILGCIIISLIFILFKSFVNSMDTKVDRLLCVAMLLGGIFTLLNVSLFTSINSSGILLLYLICIFFDTKELADLNQ